ncbi:MAG: MYXO-CTERM sorting domain-containing protein [Polyangiales bacterium]
MTRLGRMFGVSIGCVVGMLAASLPGSAAAQFCMEAPDLCGWHKFLPRTGATIPQNTPAVAWQLYLTGDPQEAIPEIRYLRVDRDRVEDVDFTAEATANGLYWLRAALQVGARYRLEESPPGACHGSAVEFEVGEPAPFPKHLGILEATSEEIGCLRVASSSSACAAPLPAAVARTRLKLDRSAEPWAALLMFQTLVDGKRWWSQANLDNSAGVFGRSDDLLFAECSGPVGFERAVDIYIEGLAASSHRARISATLPGTERTLATLATAEQAVDLRCPEAPKPLPDEPLRDCAWLASQPRKDIGPLPHDPALDVDAGVESGEGSSPSTVDAGAPARVLDAGDPALTDARAPTGTAAEPREVADAGLSDAGQRPATPVAHKPDAGGCSATSADSTAGIAWGWLGLSVIATSRRRRQRHL